MSLPRPTPAPVPTVDRSRVDRTRPGPLRPSRSDDAAVRILGRLAAIATLLGVVELALVHLGPAPMPPTSGTGATLATWSTWSSWLSHVGPAGALMGVVRLAALGLAGHLLLVVTVELLGRATGLVRLQVIGARISTRLSRRLVAQVAGIGVAATVTLLSTGPTAPAVARPISMQAAEPTPPSTAGPVTTAAPPVPVMRSLDPTTPAGPSVPVMRSLGDAAAPSSGPAASRPGATVRGTDHGDHDPGPEPATEAPAAEAPIMRALVPTGPLSPAEPGSGPSAPTAGPDPGAPPDVAPTADPTVPPRWVIRPGDHLWGVARRTLAGAWHRPPTDAEVARYLDALVSANATVLVVPGDADLVLPGQVFALPPVPAA